MILEETVNKFVRDAINLILNDPSVIVIRGRQDAAAPSGNSPYAAVNFVNETPIGWDQSTYSDSGEDLGQTIEGMREIMLSVDFYRTGARDNARRCKQGVIRNSIREFFVAADLGYVRSSEVRDISVTLGDGWEDRAQFDIVLSAVGTDTDIVRSIQSVNIQAEYQFRGIAYNQSIMVQ